jgi:two-component system sensor histidine kinase CpxA
MRSLFLKVFLWFWLAMALVIGALFLTTELTRERQQFPMFSGMDKAMDAFAQLAALTFEREGRDGLVKLFGEPEGSPHVVFYLFDERGAELTGRSVPPAVLETVRRAAVTGRIVRGTPGSRMFVAHPVTTESGGRYVLVDSMGPGGMFSNQPAALALRILAVLLTAGLLCYLLARYIVAPVLKLRAVTRQVSGGDLSARVGPLLGKRRDELGAMARDFDAMAAQIEALMSAQTRLLRDISHELRSPLARLSVALDLVRKRTGPEAEGHLARIEREAERLNEMIGQLLSLSRSGAWAVRREPVDLAALVREVAEDADFEARGLNRAVETVECDEFEMEGTPSLLRSAVENVVRNAVRHTPEGTAVKVSLRRVVEGGETQAVLGVRDEGEGVPEEALSEIFRPFYRVDDSRTRETGGTGLGLAITERAVQLHGGTVMAANIPGGGFVVEIRLSPDGEIASESQSL